MMIRTNLREALDSELDRVQKRARKRLVYTPDIWDSINYIERRLANMLYVKDWVGLRFWLDPWAEHFSSSYKKKGSAMSTQVVIECVGRHRVSSGRWAVTEIKRTYCGESPIRPLNMWEYADKLAEFATDVRRWK
jgi:hypothetical protein